jgi:hypothetical protein
MPQMRRNAALLDSTGPAEPPWPPITSDPNVLHAEMMKRIEALERAIADLHQQQGRGIGDNNPPEPIELEPLLSEEEFDEIGEDVAVLKTQPPATAASAEATAAVKRLTKFGDRLRPLARSTGGYCRQTARPFRQ